MRKSKNLCHAGTISKIGLDRVAWPPKCHRRRWFEFCSKPGLRGRKPARWWPTRLPTYSPDPQDVKKCWVGQVLSTFGGSADQKLKFCKPTPTGKKSWKIQKISKNRFFLKGQKWLLEVPTDPQSGCWHPLGPPEAICWLFQKKTIFDIGWKIRFFLWKFYFGRIFFLSEPTMFLTCSRHKEQSRGKKSVQWHSTGEP